MVNVELLRDFFTNEKLYRPAIYLSTSVILTTMKFYLSENTRKVWQDFKKISMFCRPCNMVEVFWRLISERWTVHDCQLVHLALDGCIDQSGGFFQKCFVAPAHLLIPYLMLQLQTETVLFTSYIYMHLNQSSHLSDLSLWHHSLLHHHSVTQVDVT